MGAFPDDKEHFLDWILAHTEYGDFDKKPLRHTFMPRALYGQYLEYIWQDAINSPAARKHVIRHNACKVSDLALQGEKVLITTQSDEIISVDYAVIATGNMTPANLPIPNMDIYKDPKYFRDPWKQESVLNVEPSRPVLIIGNGLSMIDTIIGLHEQGFNNLIYTVSPNGFTILPHRYNGYGYDKLNDELPSDSSLFDIVFVFNKHIKKIRALGLSSVPLIDSFRPRIQEFWTNFSDEDKKTFVTRLKHLWSAGRHRIPMHIHDKLIQLMIEGTLKTYTGKVRNMVNLGSAVSVEIFNKKTQEIEFLNVSRVINCTGPDSNISRMDGHFLQKCLQRGIITQDTLFLGINANPDTYEVIDKNQRTMPNLFTIGSNLRGILWESTAVNELRQQAFAMAGHLVKKINTNLAV